jgi:hypothetical protein
MPVFRCGECRTTLEAPDRYAGLSIPCPQCRRYIRVPELARPKTRFRCPLCKAVNDLPEGLSGDIFPCPSCARRISLPRRPPAPAEPPRPAAAPPGWNGGVSVTVVPPSAPGSAAEPPDGEGFGGEEVCLDLRMLQGQAVWPACCAACSGPPETELTITSLPPGIQILSVPYCRACRERVQAEELGPAVVFEATGGVDRFLFWNAAYARAFAHENGPRLVK